MSAILLKTVCEKDYLGFKKEFETVFESKFDSATQRIEDEAIKELSLYPVKESKRKMKNVKEEDEFELISIETPEDEKSVLIKFKLDGEDQEASLEDEEDFEFYKEIVESDEELKKDEMDRIRKDFLESVKAKRK